MKLLLGDCLELMKTIPSGSVDMVMCDLPYGTTQNKWDSVIPLEPLWKEYRRICKGAVVLTAAQPFTSVLVCSNLTKFKYQWVWEKETGTGHLNAKKQPMKNIEDVLVFYAKQPTYRPQMEVGSPYKAAGKGNRNLNNNKLSGNYGSQRSDVAADNDGTRYPKQIIRISRETGANRGLHPTQKPVALMEYLIRTYTNPGDVVLDNTMGSGTTGVACANTGRKFIGIERDPEYFAIAEKRIREAELNNY